jgi:hypothetical protein
MKRRCECSQYYILTIYSQKDIPLLWCDFFMIIYKATQLSRSKKPTSPDEIKRAKKKHEMIKTIIFITLSYILLELPCFIFNGYFYSSIVGSDIGGIINSMSNNIEFSYPTFNIFILYASNKLFSKEINKLFGSIKNRLWGLVKKGEHLQSTETNTTIVQMNQSK